MPLVKSIFNWIAIKRLNEIDLFRKYPADVQRDTFENLILLASDTEWGQKYNYEQITSYDTFRKTVPLQTYDDIKPWVERLMEGETNLLWPGEIKWFAKSSGTTNDKSKFIPVSQEALDDCHIRGGKDVLFYYDTQYPNNKVLKGKGLIVGGSHKINSHNNKSYFGDLSAILIENIPFYADWYRTPKANIALMENWDEKLEKMAEATIKENVTNISGVPSWTLVLIERILAITGKNNLLEVWPTLELFIHGGISFAPYRQQYQKLIPNPDMHYLETYNASEGFFGFQDDPTDAAMLLVLDNGIFYEFIPMDEFHKPNPTVLEIGEVKTNVNYALVISTNGGLWRYIIGDTIMFTQLFPHKFIITGRTKHFINVFGEEVIVDNADRAIRMACDKTHAAVVEYTAGPVFKTENQPGAHEWVFEFDIAPANLPEFVQTLDEGLQSVNSDYEAKRFNNYNLALPIVHVVKKGTFYRWLELNGKLGGQHKIPRLSNQRKYVEEILALNTPA